MNCSLLLSDDKKLVSFFRPISLSGTPATITRTMMVDKKTGEARTLFKRKKAFGFMQIQDEILGGIYGEPSTFLIAGSKGNDPRRASVFAVKGARSTRPNKTLHKAQKNILFWESNRLGSVPVGYGFSVDQERGVMKLKDTTGHWTDVSGLLHREAEILALPTTNPNLYYLLMQPDTVDSEPGDGSYGLRHVYEYDVASKKERLLFKAVNSEVASIELDPEGEESVLVRHQDEATLPQIFNSGTANIYALLSDKYSDAWIGLHTMSEDFSLAVVSINSPTAPGLLYLFDARRNNLAMTGKQYPNLGEDNLGKVYPLRNEARDGLSIPAYVTLRHGLTLGLASNLPFVVMPHGGPHARDFRRFDWLAQMLANARYGVLQMNIRGSTDQGTFLKRPAMGGEEERW